MKQTLLKLSPVEKYISDLLLHQQTPLHWQINHIIFSAELLISCLNHVFLQIVYIEQDLLMSTCAQRSFVLEFDEIVMIH